MSKGRKVLLVEDDPLLRKAFKMALRRGDAEVIEAGSVADAKAVVAANVVAVVFTDMGLTDGGGLEVLAAVRASASAGARVIVVTGRASTERDQLLEAGFDEFLPKPISPADLCAAYERALHDAPKGSESA